MYTSLCVCVREIGSEREVHKRKKRERERESSDVKRK